MAKFRLSVAINRDELDRPTAIFASEYLTVVVAIPDIASKKAGPDLQSYLLVDQPSSHIFF